MFKMLNEALYVVRYLLELDSAENELTVFPDDTFIVSYPKSGNTWTRFLIGNLVYEDGVDFSNINRRVPDPRALSKRFLKRLPRPRILKSHQSFDPRYQRVICIVRDPRDVALSEYHFAIKTTNIAEDSSIERFVAKFVAGGSDYEYGSWGENVGSWIGAMRNSQKFRNGNFLLLRYEDVLGDPEGELSRVAYFLGIKASPDRIAVAVKRSSADQMRKLEKAQSKLWSSTKKTRQDKPFVRAAKSGSWKIELPDACIREIESAWGPLMQELGYVPCVKGASTVGSDLNHDLRSQIA
jgi:hypothetical protein